MAQKGLRERGVLPKGEGDAIRRISRLCMENISPAAG